MRNEPLPLTEPLNFSLIIINDMNGTYGDSDGNDSCVDLLSDSDLRRVLLAKGLTGGLALLASVASLVSFFLFRLFKRDHLPVIGTTERLIVSVAFAAIFRSIVVLLQTTAVDYDGGDSPVHRGLCEFTAFMDQWSIWIVLLTIQTVLVHLLLQLTFGVRFSKRKVIELLYVTVPVVVPLLFSWVPFIKDYYGLAGGWCWIRQEDEHCHRLKKGLILQIVFWFGPLAFFQIFDIVFLFMIYPLLFHRKLGNADREDKKELLRQHSPLLLLLFLSIIVNWFSLINRIYSVHVSNESIGLWIVHAVASSCWGILGAATVFLYLAALRLQQPHVEIKGDCVINDESVLSDVQYAKMQ